MMLRLHFLLLLGVLASALYLVRTQYESRRLYVELEKATQEASALDSEHERLLFEQRLQATSSRVESLAKKRLNMRPATPAMTQYVTYRETTPSAPIAP